MEAVKWFLFTYILLIVCERYAIWLGVRRANQIRMNYESMD